MLKKALSLSNKYWYLPQRNLKLADLFDEYPMLLFALEAGVALFILVIIVVWTMMGRKDQ